ncbi:ABC transporter ATP-binding protein [Pigmentiphaga soli]|uniref:ABC transporter ATP-binding protein n=1 Tax=Pigmentiphaga soli TaxID=1007095 RepID=A0ABP8H0E7_9BURK
MLELRRLDVAYGRRAIVEDLSAGPLAADTVTALLGPNGSGKSTLLKAVAGLVPLRGGQVLLDGRDLADGGFAQRARQVAYLPQSLPAAVHLRVFESVLAAAHATVGSLRAQAADTGAVMALLERLGIGHLALHYLDRLSGGQKQLAGLAQALVRQPRLLLLDEPLSALDLNHQFHVLDLLREETRERGLVTVIVLHDLNIALRHADRCLLMRGGRLLAEGAPRDVVTAETLAAAYGVRGRVETCSRGLPQVIIDGLAVSLPPLSPPMPPTP